MGDFRRGEAMDNGHSQSGALEAKANRSLLFLLGGRRESHRAGSFDFFSNLVGVAEDHAKSVLSASVAEVVLAVDSGCDDFLRCGCFDAHELWLRPR